MAAKNPSLLRDRQHEPDRLHHLPRRQIGEGPPHRGDEVLHAEESANGVLVQQHGSTNLADPGPVPYLRPTSG